jgi:nucleoside-diphosphate-sugar epimerase
MKVLIIGGTGHIGHNLVAMFLDDGCDVVVISSGRTKLAAGVDWDRATMVQAGYGSDGWADCLRQQEADVVVDILGRDAPGVYDAVKSNCRHFLLCGSIWMFGDPRSVPTPDEPQTPSPFEEYASRYVEMLALRASAAQDGIAFTAVMPPNICGPGKVPLDGMGGRSVDVHKAHQAGKPAPLPAPGNNLIGPCDGADVAQPFFLAAQNRDAGNGEIFNVGAAYALTAKQFIETYGQIYGVTIPIEWYGWPEYAESINPSIGANFHFSANMCPDISKARTLLGYEPKYTCEETMERAVGWMRNEGIL